jgi:hypothetical protein
MADLSDVEAALVNTITGIMYPSGTASPSALPGEQVAELFRGWPNSTSLSTNLTAGIVSVNVYALPNHSRLTTRYPTAWHPAEGGQTALSLSVTKNSATTATFSGTCSAGQLAGVMLDNIASVYQVKNSDTPTTVAAALAALVPGASASGAILTVPLSQSFSARTGGQVIMQRELRRQAQGFQVTFWCPTQPSRDAAASLVDAGLAGMDFIRLPDAAWGRLLYVGSSVDDVPSKEGLWKRNLIYTVEYGTTQNNIVQTMLFGGVQIQAGGDTTTPETYY